jgi:hypothetical protein
MVSGNGNASSSGGNGCVEIEIENAVSVDLWESEMIVFDAVRWVCPGIANEVRSYAEKGALVRSHRRLVGHCGDRGFWSGIDSDDDVMKRYMACQSRILGVWENFRVSGDGDADDVGFLREEGYLKLVDFGREMSSAGGDGRLSCQSWVLYYFELGEMPKCGSDGGRAGERVQNWWRCGSIVADPDALGPKWTSKGVP